MNKKMSLLLSSLFLFAGITACSQQSDTALMLPPNEVSNISSQIDNQYLVTAKAIVDSMAKNPSASDQEKLVKDFKVQIKNTNRPTLENLIKYTVKVLQSTTPAGQDLMKSPLIKLVHEAQTRYLDLHVSSPAHQKSMDIFMIAIEKDSAKQEKLLQKFESTSFKSYPKMDLKNLISIVKAENSNMDDYLDPNSEIAQRIIHVLEKALNS